MTVKPIEHDRDFDRWYIPLPGGWEVQTKGSGSTFRICDPKGHRLSVPESPYLHGEIEQMARDIHAATFSQAVRHDELSVLDKEGLIQLVLQREALLLEGRDALQEARRFCQLIEASTLKADWRSRASEALAVVYSALGLTADIEYKKDGT